MKGVNEFDFFFFFLFLFGFLGFFSFFIFLPGGQENASNPNPPNGKGDGEGPLKKNTRICNSGSVQLKLIQSKRLVERQNERFFFTP